MVSSARCIFRFLSFTILSTGYLDSSSDHYPPHKMLDNNAEVLWAQVANYPITLDVSLADFDNYENPSTLAGSEPTHVSRSRMCTSCALPAGLRSDADVRAFHLRIKDYPPEVCKPLAPNTVNFWQCDCQSMNVL